MLPIAKQQRPRAGSQPKQQRPRACSQPKQRCPRAGSLWQNSLPVHQTVLEKDETAAMTDSIANSVMQIMPHVNDANSIEIAAMQIMPHVNDAN